MPQRAPDADDAQVVLLRSAVGAPRVRTAAAPSVFDLARPAPTRRSSAAAPDPAALPVVKGPPPLRRPGPPSAWQAVWDSLQPGGDGRAMTPEQAKAFAAWARQHGHSGKLTRRKANGATAHVWRKA